MLLRQSARLLIEFLECEPWERRVEIDRARLAKMLAGWNQLGFAIMRELWEPERRQPLAVYETAEDRASRAGELLVTESNQSYSVVELKRSDRERSCAMDPSMTDGELDGRCIHRRCHDQVSQVRALRTIDPAMPKVRLIEKVLGPYTPSGAYDPYSKYGHINQLLMHKCLVPSRDQHGRITKEVRHG